MRNSRTSVPLGLTSTLFHAHHDPPHPHPTGVVVFWCMKTPHPNNAKMDRSLGIISCRRRRLICISMFLATESGDLLHNTSRNNRNGGGCRERSFDAVGRGSRDRGAFCAVVRKTGRVILVLLRPQWTQSFNICVGNSIVRCYKYCTNWNKILLVSYYPEDPEEIRWTPQESYCVTYLMIINFVKKCEYCLKQVSVYYLYTGWVNCTKYFGNSCIVISLTILFFLQFSVVLEK